MKNKRKISVIKIGGTLLETKSFPRFAKEFSRYLKNCCGVIVHGGGKEVTSLCKQLNLEQKFVHGLRYTDSKTMEIVEMVLSGKMNPYVVSVLNHEGISALGVSGKDLSLIQAKQIRSLGFVGVPTKVKTDQIRLMFSNGWVPVFSSIAKDKKGNSLNVNADDMASAIAVALRAYRLILFTDVPGILDDFGKTIPQISRDEAEKLIRKKVITGGMIPKIRSAFRALKKGIEEIWILEGILPLEKAGGTLLTLKKSVSQHPFV